MPEIKFDQALKDLEKLVGDMEEEELSLEEGLEKYEKGIKLSRICMEKLARAEKKIEILKQPVGEDPETEPFVESEDSGLGEKN